MTITSQPVRRTQEERRTSTRAALLDATIESLVRYGYSGTTVARIAELAGVTRGAQIHHYRTKDELVTAATARLIERTAEQWVLAIESIEPDRDEAASRLIDVLWESHQASVFEASAELWVAARTDPGLIDDASAIQPEITRAAVAIHEQLSHSYPDRAAFMAAFFTIMDAIRGLMLPAWSEPADTMEARWRRARPLLLSLLVAAQTPTDGKR